MNLSIGRALRNMLLIGGLVSTTSFFIGFGKGFTMFKNHYPLGLKSFNFSDIKTIDNIEDLEYAKGCKFFFYNKTTSGSVEVKDARGYSLVATSEENKESKLVDEVVKEKEKCEKDRIVYIGF